jgi:hypothetical protein
MTEAPHSDLPLSERIHDIPRILEAMRRGVRAALWMHKVTGNPVPEWRNGQVVWVQPDDIPVDSFDDDEPLHADRD